MSRSFSSIIALLLSMHCFAGTAEPIDSNTAGSGTNTLNFAMTVPIAELSSVVCLIAGGAQAGGSNYLGFYSMNAPVSQSQYQVPVGKTLNLKTASYMVSPGPAWLIVGFSDSILPGENMNIAPLNPIFFAAGSGTANFPIPAITSSLYYSRDVSWKIPAQKFPFMRADTTTSVVMTVCGLEQ